MTYTLRTLPGADPLVLSSLAGSTAAVVRAVGGYQRDLWSALWRSGVKRVDDPSGAVVLHYITAAEHARGIPPQPSITTPPVDTVKALVPVTVAYATMESGSLVARAADGTNIADAGPAPTPGSAAAWVLRNGRLTLETVAFVGNTVDRSGLPLSTSTLAHAPAGAVVAAADGSTYLTHAVWRQFIVAGDGTAAVPLGGGASIPATAAAATIADAAAAWSADVSARVARGESVTATVVAVAADGSLWFGARSVDDVTAVTSAVTTFGAIAPGSGLVTYNTDTNGSRVGATWRFAML